MSEVSPRKCPWLKILLGGVALGVLVLSAVDNVMSLMNVSSYLQMVVKGLILLLAVCMDVCMNQSKFRLKKAK